MLLLLSSAVPGFTQESKTFTIHGQLVTPQGQPIPYAHIALLGFAYGTSTNLTGEFELKLNVKYGKGFELKISSIGYQSRSISTDEINPSQKLTITLLPSSTQLENVIIGARRYAKKDHRQAARLVAKALRRVPANYIRNPNLLNTFYRHYCTEDSQYVRLVEAAIDVFDKKGYGEYHKIPEERLAFRVNQLRRSFDFTESTKLTHPPVSLNYLIINDLTSYTYNNYLRSEFNNIEFFLSDTTELDGETVYEVGFTRKEEGSAAKRLSFDGRMFIDARSFAFHRIELSEEKLEINNRDTTRQLLTKRIFYRKLDDRYYAERLITDLEAYQRQYDSLFNASGGWDHTSHIELMVNNIQDVNSEMFQGGEPTAQDLRDIDYDSTFWEDYTVLKATPVEKKIINDLSKDLSLRKQFESYNTLDRGGISITANQQYVDLIKALEGKPLYVVAWAKWGYPNFYELQPMNYIRRMLRKGKMHLVFVGIEESATDWEYFKHAYGLDIRFAKHLRLDLGMNNKTVRKFFNNSMPYSLIYNKQGKVQMDAPPLLNDEKLKPIFKELIKGN